MSLSEQDFCPECGRRIRFICGIGECECGYSDILSPCVGCLYTPDECLTPQHCKDWINWNKIYGGKRC